MCPDCQTRMVVFELEGVEIDRCMSCGGTWLDAGELETILQLAGADPQEFYRNFEASTKTSREGRRRCVRCPKKLEGVTIMGEHPVELDRCPLGHGFWFDKEEIERVVSRFAKKENAVVARFFSELYRHELRKEGA